MELLDFTLRYYRLHQDTKVTFDSAITLIGGPNESGKSTLIEALHRALFLRAKTGGKLQTGMVSTQWGGIPEVMLRFRADGDTWTLDKRFAGNNTGRFRLSSDSGETLLDTSAEERLSQLLGGVSSAGGNGAQSALEQCWPHLLIRQGTSFENPETESKAAAGELLRRLQAEGGAAVIASQRDEAVLTYFIDLADKIFTSTGNPKAGSPLRVAEESVAQAREAAGQAEERAKALHQAASNYQEAGRRLDELDKALPKHRERLQELERKLETARTWEERIQSRENAFSLAQARLENLKKEQDDILRLAEECAATKKELAPAEAGWKEALKEVEIAEKIAQETEVQAEAARCARREEDQRSRWLHAKREHALAESDLQKLETIEKTTKAQWEDKAHWEERRGNLPKITRSDLDELRAHQTALDKAVATLSAVAADLEWTEGEGKVELNGQPLKREETVHLSDTAILRINEILTLRLRPGGGEGLAEARRKEAESRRQLEEALNVRGVKSLSEAVETAERRAETERVLEQLNKELQAVAGDDLPERLGSARNTLREAETKLRSFASEPFSLAGAEDAENIRRRLQEHNQRLEECQRMEEETDRQAKERREAASRAREHARQAEEKFRREKDSLNEKRTRLTVLVEQHGDAIQQKERLSTADEDMQRIQVVLEDARQALTELQPDVLRGDKERLSQALETCQAAQKEAWEQRAAARSLLQRDGHEDLEAALTTALERVRETEEQLAVRKRHAEAIRLLANSFREEKKRLAQEYSAPLVERINHYLVRVFGPDGRMHLEFGSDGIRQITLVRDTNGSFAFGCLSHGAREQLATAVRLATAEILATAHGGHLPIVFDDAFTQSDHERLDGILSMLHHAASRGLQIIVLTCNPADYDGLPAGKRIHLSPPSKVMLPASNLG